MPVGPHQFRHAKVRDLCPLVLCKKNIVAGEVTVDDIVAVEVCKGQGYVVTEVDHSVEGEGGEGVGGGEGEGGGLQEGGEARIH